MKNGMFIAAAAATMLLSTGAHAQNYFQGFETDNSGWNGTVNRVASGTNGIAAANGGFYGQLISTPDGYDTGYGDAGYTRFGYSGASSYTGPFTQSVSVYLNTQTAPASNPSVPAFWIDAAPYSTGPNGYEGEHNFRLSYTGTGINIGFDDQAPAVNVTNTGWYTFQFAYSRGAAASDPTSTTLSVLNSANAIIGQATLANNNGGPLLSGDLGGPFYLWFTVWQNGFSGNQLAIDNVSATAAVPEPATWAMMIMGFGLMGGALRRRQTKVAFA